MARELQGDSTVDRSTSLTVEQQDALDLYEAQLKHDSITPREWLRRQPQPHVSPDFRDRLWRHYALAFPPPHVPGFDIIDVLGEGGMGKVYLARDLHLNRLVAIKEITGELHRNAQFRERFRNEAQILAKLKHPNIVEVYQFLPHERREFLVMEYVDGGSLNDRLAANRPEPHALAVSWLIKLARAVAHAHDEHIIHRDLKPANILFDKNGEPKISDFGLAKNLLDPTDRTHGRALGTERYMAPEQIDGQAPGPGTDIWALGVMLYRLLTGRLPFDGKTRRELWDNICRDEPAPFDASVPPRLQEICGNCLAKRPADRYASARELAEDLEAFAKGESDSTVAWRRPPAGRRRRRWLILSGAALLLACSVVLVLWGVRDKTPAAVRMKDVHTGYCSSIVFAPDGLHAYSENGNFEVFLWDLKRGVKESVIFHGLVPEPQRDEGSFLAISPNGKWLAVVSKTILGDPILKLFNLASGDKTPRAVPNFSKLSAMAFSLDSGTLAMVQRRAEFLGFRKPATAVNFFEIEKGANRISPEFEGRGLSLAFAPDGKFLAVGCDDGKIRLWNMETNKIERVLDTRGGAVNQLAFDEKGKRIFTASFADGSLGTWDADTGSEAGRISVKELAATMTCAAFWSGGRAVSGHKDGAMIVWDLEHRSAIYQFTQPGTEVTAVAIAANGKHALSGLSDRSVYLHQLRNP